jgi:hypothetical protein
MKVPDTEPNADERGGDVSQVPYHIIAHDEIALLGQYAEQYLQNE